MPKLGETGEVISDVVGWFYFLAWSISFYPQVWMNWRRKSVVGLSFDYEAYNIIGFACYAAFNTTMYWSTSIQHAYEEKHHHQKDLVTLNDVIFSLHAVALTLFTIFQMIIYEKGGQKVSLLCWILSIGMVGSIFGYLGFVVGSVNAPLVTWLGFLYWLSYIKLAITTIKYMPQVYLNWKRKSTVGWNIWNVLLDFTGGGLSVLQLFFDAWRKSDFSGVTGDPVKFGLGLVSIVFDIIFMFQHYVLYRNSNETKYKPLFNSQRESWEENHSEEENLGDRSYSEKDTLINN